MNSAIKSYLVLRYGSIITLALDDKFKDEFPYMEGCNMAVITPEKYMKKKTIPLGIMSTCINQGGTWK